MITTNSKINFFTYLRKWHSFNDIQDSSLKNINSYDTKDASVSYLIYNRLKYIKILETTSFTLGKKLREVSRRMPRWRYSGPSLMVTSFSTMNFPGSFSSRLSSNAQNWDKLSNACLAPKYVTASISIAIYSPPSSELVAISSL